MEKRHPNHPGELGTDARYAVKERLPDELNARAEAIQVLTGAQVPFLVGGAYAYANYTGIYRDTKDLDLFPMKRDAARALEVLEAHGWRTERTDEVWLYKAFKGEWFVDFIFSSGNGVATVDSAWFEHAKPGVAFEQPVSLIPPEEMIWSKGFVLERERYDGADVAHLFRGVGASLDWERLLRRFDRYWEVLLSHLMLFRFAYPCDRDAVPTWVMEELLARTRESVLEGSWSERICRGNLMSRVNYGVDIREWGYRDGRAWDEDERREEGQRAKGSELEGASSGGR